MKQKKPYDRKEPFNHLPLLPPEEHKIWSEKVLKILAKTSRSLGKLDGMTATLPNPEMLVNNIFLQEAKSSSEIENIFTTEDELYKALSNTTTEEKANTATKEVLRYREALWSGLNSLKEEGEIKTTTIIEIYQKIKQTKQTIRTPQSRTVIRKSGSSLTSGDVVYTPPRGEKIIEEKLDNLITFINDDEQYPIDPLIKMILSHYQFEAIHPFTDGNGRTGRILNLLLLFQKNLLTHPILYLSKYIIQHKADYYHCISGVTQRADWESWILFMLEAVDQTTNYTITVIEAITLQMRDTYTYTKDKLPFFNKEMLEVMFTQPYIKRKIIGEIAGTKSRTTSTKYMKELCRIGVLTEKREGREVYYVNHDLINILSGKA